jgi:acylphosphatase
MSDPGRRDGPDPSGGDAPRIRAEAVVRGRVQGVGYRVFAARSAGGLGLGGWVANEPDGSVRCLVEGPAPIVEACLRELARGPLGSTVTAVEIVRSPSLTPIDRFEIRSGWHSGD